MLHKCCFFLLGLLLWVSCDQNPDNTGDNFDRTALLQQMADQLIKPAYADLQQKADAVHTAATAFVLAPDVNQLTLLRSAWSDAYTTWQSANAYNFGPAGEAGLQKGLIEEIGTFPVSETKVATAINTAQWNMNDFNRDARGFLTVEYLIYGKGADAATIVNQFQQDANHGAFLKAVTGNLVERITVVNDAWKGAYYNEFTSNNGTDVGSSTSHLYNEFVRSYEAVKNFKVGLPLGKRAGQTSTEPTLVEAYYNGQSLFFLKKNLEAIENIWYGRGANGVDGIGFREYLEAVEGGGVLITNTESQLSALHSALDAVPATPDMSEQIVANPAALETLHTELQKLTRFFKSDLSSLLGIAITFSSSDGD